MEILVFFGKKKINLIVVTLSNIRHRAMGGSGEMGRMFFWSFRLTFLDHYAKWRNSDLRPCTFIVLALESFGSSGDKYGWYAWNYIFFVDIWKVFQNTFTLLKVGI